MNGADQEGEGAGSGPGPGAVVGRAMAGGRSSTVIHPHTPVANTPTRVNHPTVRPAAIMY
ncbi:hypothetical protein GZL_00302 [Streptomyces sp. 769]|nr:hypothetical protein GZL_00302 [Streptomyces sp. 769]